MKRKNYDYRKVEAMRELRMWIKDVIVPGVGLLTIGIPVIKGWLDSMKEGQK